MVEIRTKLERSDRAEVHGRLTLPFESRQKSRLRAKLASGEEVLLVLPRGEVLRGGDLVGAADGRTFEIVAQDENVLHVECSTPAALARVAYHLGNRHVPVEVGEGHLRIAADHVLEEMVRRLGASARSMQAPFEPEAGAYGAHRHDEMGHGGKIHEFGDAHRHDHHHHHK